jgi:hypothetical protein
VEARLGSINEQGKPGITNGSGAGSTAFASNTIDEVMDES